MSLQYTVNKGVNRSIEFRGLRAQYIFYLAIGLAVLLLCFTILYITGVPVLICVCFISAAGSGLFYLVYRLSHKYGEHGLMKMFAYKRLPAAIRCTSRKYFKQINSHKKEK